MNAPSDISMKTDEVLRVELEVFRREHRDLDEAIRALEEKGTADQLTINQNHCPGISLTSEIPKQSIQGKSFNKSLVGLERDFLTICRKLFMNQF